MNTKYALVTDEEQLPIGNWTLVTDSYLDFIKVYENDNYRKLGTSYDYAIPYEDFNGNYKSLSDVVICNKNDLEIIRSYLGNNETELIDISYENNSLVGNYSSANDTFMVITVPYDKGWSVFIDGVEIEKYNVNGGFLGIPILKGSHFIEMHFMPSGLKIGVISSIIGAILLLGIIVIDNIDGKWYRKRNKM